MVRTPTQTIPPHAAWRHLLSCFRFPIMEEPHAPASRRPSDNQGGDAESIHDTMVRDTMVRDTMAHEHGVTWCYPYTSPAVLETLLVALPTEHKLKFKKCCWCWTV